MWNMVSSQFTGFKPIDAVDVDHVELDFSDVFGPKPLDEADSANLCLEGERKLVFDDPEVIFHRSHSLVGPSSYLSQSFGLSKLTIHDSEDSVETNEFISEDAVGKILEPSSDDALVERNLEGLSLNPTKVQGVGIDDFEILKVVGAGAFAKVYQVRKKGTSEIFAMKVMRKDKIMEKNHAEYMIAEREILTKVEHPYIVQLRYSFQTKYRLYLVLDFVNGGHLFFQLYHHGLFREELARIYAAEIVSAVSHLHDNGIMHRDLKPENILLDVDGHVMLTDFGLAKQFDANTRANSLCGTVEYMSPEIVLGKGHDKTADWWSVGILVFEMLTGKPPFTGSRHKVQQKIVKDKIKLPVFLSSEAHSLLKGLLQKDASKRLGNGQTGGEDIKRHKWFKAIDWKKLEARGIEPSFRPQVAGKNCVANFEKHWTDMPIADSPVASPKGGGNAFTGFNYVRPPASFLSRESPVC